MKNLRFEELRVFCTRRQIWLLQTKGDGRVICVRDKTNDFTFYMKTKGDRLHVDQDIGRRIILIYTLK